MKKYMVSLILTILLLCSAISISADVDGIFEMWKNQDGKITLISIYNEDCTECRGPEYQEKVCQMAEGGCTCCGICYSDSCGGGGAPVLSSYEENYFLKTVLKMQEYPDEETWLWNSTGIRSTPDGIQYYDDETGNWVDVPPEMELPIQVEDLQLQGLFDHDVKAFWIWFNFGGAEITTIPTINPDGTEAHWVFDDYWVDRIHIIHSQITVDGKEVWDKKTIFFEVPNAGGLPTLEPKNYGVQILGTKYGPQSIDEIPPELLNYAKEINGQLYTYSDSKLDIWLYENIYKSNHDKSFIE